LGKATAKIVARCQIGNFSVFIEDHSVSEETTGKERGTIKNIWGQKITSPKTSDDVDDLKKEMFRKRRAKRSSLTRIPSQRPEDCLRRRVRSSPEAAFPVVRLEI
jgi:hypothetical protein